MAQCSSFEGTKDSPDLFDDSLDLMEIDEEKLCESVDNDNETRKGASITEIYQGDSPWVAPEFPKIVPDCNHTVLFQLPQKDENVCVEFNAPPLPYPGRDMWDKDYVRMPCSNQSLYPVEENGKTTLKNRWKLIFTALSKPIRNSQELESAILEYNSKYKNQWKFHVLHKLFNEYLEEEEAEYFFQNTLPKMKELVLKLPQIIPNAIPLLRQNENKSISMSQWQAACLLANGFFCTFPRRNSRKPKSEYSMFPDINFNRLFQSGGSQCVLEKLKCICHYFRRVCSKVPTGVITYSRHFIDPKDYPEWQKSVVYVGSIPLHIDSKGTIEDQGIGLLQVDFANKFLGGGVLGHGCVQEEIRFIVCPELLVSMLFTEALKPNEAFLIIGCERYSDYVGYAESFQWEKNHIDTTFRDSSGRLRCAIIAIDALRFSNPVHQFRPELMTRELNKAFTGYSVCPNESMLGYSLPGVATGNWGCGAFCGSPYLKSLLQIMACSVAHRPLAYFTFGDTQLRDDINNIYNFLSKNNTTVGELFSYLCEFYKLSLSSNQLYPFLLQSLKDKKSKCVQKFFNNIPSESSRNCQNATLTNDCGSKNSESMSTMVEVNINPSSSNKSSKNENNMHYYNVNAENNNGSIKVGKMDTEFSSASNITLYDSMSTIEATDSSYKHESPVKKKRAFLPYFEKHNIKTSETNTEKKEDLVPKTMSPSHRNNAARKTGKISDYFQPIMKK